MSRRPGIQDLGMQSCLNRVSSHSQVMKAQVTLLHDELGSEVSRPLGPGGRSFFGPELMFSGLVLRVLAITLHLKPRTRLSIV